MKKYSFLFPACRHFFVTCLIVLIVSYTFLLCSSFLCAFTGSKIGLFIYIKHLGVIASAAIFSHSFFFYSNFLLIHNLTFYFGTQWLTYIVSWPSFCFFLITFTIFKVILLSHAALQDPTLIQAVLLKIKLIINSYMTPQ